jgi:hypothetical protein
MTAVLIVRMSTGIDAGQGETRGRGGGKMEADEAWLGR